MFTIKPPQVTQGERFIRIHKANDVITMWCVTVETNQMKLLLIVIFVTSCWLKIRAGNSTALIHSTIRVVLQLM